MIYGALFTLTGMAAVCAAVVSFIYRRRWPRAHKSLLTLVVGSILAFGWMRLAAPTQKSVEQLVKSGVAVGATEEQVKTFLESHRIFYQEFDGGISASTPDAIITDCESAFLISFYFSKQGTLKYFTVVHWMEAEDE